MTRNHSIDLTAVQRINDNSINPFADPAPSPSWTSHRDDGSNDGTDIELKPIHQTDDLERGSANNNDDDDTNASYRRLPSRSYYLFKDSRRGLLIYTAYTLSAIASAITLFATGVANEPRYRAGAPEARVPDGVAWWALGTFAVGFALALYEAATVGAAGAGTDARAGPARSWGPDVIAPVGGREGERGCGRARERPKKERLGTFRMMCLMTGLVAGVVGSVLLMLDKMDVGSK